MAWSDMVVFADGSENGIARAKMGAVLAAQMEARLEVCVLALTPPPLPYGRAAQAVAEARAEALQLARDDAGRAADAARAILSSQASLSIQAPEVERGKAARFAGGFCRAADLAIVGQPISEDRSDLDDTLLEGALLQSGRPCLVLPRWTSAREWGANALVAWKGTPEAARALHEALPLLRQAKQVRIFVSGDGSDNDGDGPHALARLVRHLERHGVKADAPKVGAPVSDAGAAILREAEEFGADLLVMGGYGHSRLREWAFGGATRAIIRQSHIPVFMAH